MGLDEAMIVAGIGSRKGVSTDEVFAAIHAALAAHDLDMSDLSALATTAFKKDEAAISAAGRALNLRVIISDTPSPSRLRLDTSPPVPEGEDKSAGPYPPPLLGGEVSRRSRDGGGEADTPIEKSTVDPQTLTTSAISLAIAGTPSVSESAALAAAGPNARLLGPRIAVGPVTCALATSEARPVPEGENKGAGLYPPPLLGGEVSRRSRDGGGEADTPTKCPVADLHTLTRSAISLAIAGTPSVSESAALAAAGPNARLLGPRIAVGPVTCALATSEARPVPEGENKGAGLYPPPLLGGEVSRRSRDGGGEADTPTKCPVADLHTLTRSAISLAITGTPSVSESAALAAAGPNARLLGPRIAVGPVAFALATSETPR